MPCSLVNSLSDLTNCSAGKQPGAAVQPAAPIDAAAAAAFERVTEAASALMDSGELDVYSQRR